MFCPTCGNEIPNGAEFCPSCGAKISSSTHDNMKETIKKAADLASNSAKTLGNKVNEATDGKAGLFAQTAQDKAKETAKNFSADMKQAMSDKDPKGFFTKNKYRNSKIIAVIILAIIIVSSLFSGGKKQYEIAEKAAYVNTASLSDVKKVKSTNVELVGYNPETKGYTILVSVKADSTYGSECTMFQIVGLNKDYEITACKSAKSVIPSNKKEEKDYIKMATEEFKASSLKLK